VNPRLFLRFTLIPILLSTAIAWHGQARADSLTLIWEDKSSNEEGFNIERKEGVTGTFTQIATVEADVQTYTDTEVLGGTTYCYRVNAFNESASSAYSNEACHPQPPSANAGQNQTMSDSDGDGSETVILDGSGSSDPDGAIVSYEWKVGFTVLGTGVTLTQDFSLGSRNIILTVTDDDGAVDNDDVMVTVLANQSPIGKGGPNQTVPDGDVDGVETVTLDGSASSDPDGSIVSYAWTEGATVLGTTAVITPVLALGTHNITLTVVDNGGLAGSDTVVVSVTEISTTAIVSAITYTTTGGKGGDKHLVTTLSVVDNLGSPVANASVALDLLQDGVVVKSITFKGQKLTTGSDGSASFTLNGTGSGCYETVILGLVSDGLAWDGVSSPNQYCKQ